MHTVQRHESNEGCVRNMLQRRIGTEKACALQICGNGPCMFGALYVAQRQLCTCKAASLYSLLRYSLAAVYLHG